MIVSTKTYMFVYLLGRPDLERLEGCMRSTFDIWPDDDGHRYHCSHNYSLMNDQLLKRNVIGHSQIDNHNTNHLNFAKMNRKNHLTTRRGQNDLRY